MQFHVLSFEGPDPYARAGGLASRVDGLTEALAALGFETHLWFVGDPDRAGLERHDELRYHRWGQWISHHHPGGVYDGEEGAEVRALAQRLGLRWVDRTSADGEAGFLDALSGLDDVDVVNLCAHVGPAPRRLLFHNADAVLANSAHEPFGLVGLEAMAVGGLACTGSSGEDYVLPGQNAVMLETDDPSEFTQLYGALRANPSAERAIRRAGRWTARRFAWPKVLHGVFLPRLNAGLRS